MSNINSDSFTQPSHETRIQILERALIHVPFEGWTSRALKLAVKDCGLPVGSDQLFFAGGVNELIDFWSKQCDARAREEIIALPLSQMKIRERVCRAVIIRLAQSDSHPDAAKRAMAKLSLPTTGPQGVSSLWASADMIWRAIGDRSTDGNFYSKRSVLSLVLLSTYPVWLSDDTEDKSKAKAFLDQRIDNVMQFEKAKAQLLRVKSALPDPVAALSQLRFGQRKSRRPYQSRY